MKPIVGIGELLWDIYPDGRKVIGGAPFNFAFHCHQLGHEAVIVSRVGDDELGRELREEVKRLGMSDEFIQTDYEHPTGTVRVTLDDKGQPSYEIVQDVAWDYLGNEGHLSQDADIDEEGFWNDVRAVCYGTLAQRNHVPRSTFEAITAQSWMLRVFDTNIRSLPIDRKLFRQSLIEADWIKLNETESRIVCEVFSADWFERMNIEYDSPERVLIVTRGDSGVSIRCENNAFEIPAAPANVVDTVGAGDAFTAAMVVMHLEGKPLKDCVRFASHYAAKVCEHQGATPIIARSEIEKVVFR
jgi:fructokinase